MLVLAFDTGPKAHGWAIVSVEADLAEARMCGGLKYGAHPLTVVPPMYSPGLIAIEAPLHAYSAKTASAIIATSRAAGELGGAARALGYRVEYVTAADWRAGLLGAANAHDAAVKAWVEQHIQGWPKRSNPHTRDAAALAVWAGRRALREAP